MSERILIVDLKNMTAEAQDYSYERDKVYGRGLVLELFRRLVPNGIGRYSPENIIVLVPGFFVGNAAPSACRMLVATIESETGGIQVCNTTGDMPQRLASLGIAAVVIRGKAEKKGTIVHISEAGTDFSVAENLTGCRARTIVEYLRSEYGRDCAVIGGGIAADLQLPLSTFFCTYPDGEPMFHSPRNGFGDVWGAKNLRAVVVNSSVITGRECAEPDRFRSLGKLIADKIIHDEICGGALPAYGSVVIMKILKDRQSLSELPALEAKPVVASDRSGPRLNRNCAPMCVIGCLNRHAANDGRCFSSPAQIETLAAIENCFGVEDYDLADEIQRTATDIGIVGTEFVTACKTFAVACGIDDGEKHLLEWLGEIERGSLTGRTIASRTAGVARLYPDRDLARWMDRDAVEDEELFNVRMVSTYKGLSDMSELDLLYAQVFVLENLGFCIFTSFALLDREETFEILAEMFEARTGAKMSAEQLIADAYGCIDGEKAYHEKRWKAARKSSIPPFTKVLYRYFDRLDTEDN